MCRKLFNYDQYVSVKYLAFVVTAKKRHRYCNACLKLLRSITANSDLQKQEILQASLN